MNPRSPPTVRVVEVGPRDGLQNESIPVSTEIKLALIRRLAATGLLDIEATAFVSPKWVPQMADHAAVMAGLPSALEFPGVDYPVLVPNLVGYEAALRAGARTIAVFASASEGFSQRNINCSIGESLKRFEPVIQRARLDGIRVRGYVSCVVACPYEGAIAPAQVASVAGALSGMGCYEVSLGDTVGRGTPSSVLSMLDAVGRLVTQDQLAGHFHDTFGMAVANVYAAYLWGLRCFDSSVAGLGGCPYAQGATGNVATEDLVYLLHSLGADTGVVLEDLVAVGEWICQVLGRVSSSRTGKALMGSNSI